MEPKRHLYRALIDNFLALGIPRNCVLSQLHELPAQDIAIRGARYPSCPAQASDRAAETTSPLA